MKRQAPQSGILVLLFLALFAAVRMSWAQDYPRYPGFGSTFVPLDSWVYPALDRLAAYGYVTTSLGGMKPWTRLECARLTDEARDAMTKAIRENRKPEEQAVRLHAALERELASELEALGGGRYRTVRLESVYTRVLSISGPLLTDGFHFGQTVAYDFGRPFRRGTNAIVGASFRASAGPLALYVRAEYQHAPSASALSDSVRNLIASVDKIPLQPAHPFDAVNRARLLDSYISLNLKNWQFSFGKQSLSWGVGEGGSMLLSDNAEPLYMARITRVVPAKLPGLLNRAGPFRMEFFLGRLEGGVVVAHPLIYGHKFSFKVNPYLEVGYGRTVILGGNAAHGASPFTTANFICSFLGVRRAGGIPGDNRNAFDAVVRIPGLRNSVLLYGELYADDLAFYFVRPPRGAYRVGFYVARLPWLPRIDFRAEAASTVSAPTPDSNGPFNYSNFEYRDGYTNLGVLMGNTVGREGQTYQFWSSYRFGPRNTLQLSLKHSLVDPALIPQGASWQDYSARHEIHLRSGFYVRAFLQYEHIRRFPALFNGPVKNVTAAAELGFAPEQPKP